MSEYAHYIQCVVAPNNTTSLEDMVKQFPKGAKRYIDVFQSEDEARVDGSNEFKLDHDLQGCLADNSQVEIVDVGIPREHLDSCRRAIEVGHPRSVAMHLSGVVKEALSYKFESEPHQVAKLRTQFFLKWTKRAKELASDELAFQAKAPEHLRGLLKGKRLLLLKEILNELQYRDTSLVDDILNGFPITGWLPKSMFSFIEFVIPNMISIL